MELETSDLVARAGGRTETCRDPASPAGMGGRGCRDVREEAEGCLRPEASGGVRCPVAPSPSCVFGDTELVLGLCVHQSQLWSWLLVGTPGPRPPPGSGSQHLQGPGVDSEPHAGFGARASLGPRATALRTGLAEAVPNVWVLRRSRSNVRDGSETAPRPQLSRCSFHVMSGAIFVPRERLAMSGDISVTTGRGCCRRLLGGGPERGAGAPQSHREACVWPRVSVSPPVSVFTSVSLSLPLSPSAAPAQPGPAPSACAQLGCRAMAGVVGRLRGPRDLRLAGWGPGRLPVARRFRLSASSFDWMTSGRGARGGGQSTLLGLLIPSHLRRPDGHTPSNV